MVGLPPQSLANSTWGVLYQCCSQDARLDPLLALCILQLLVCTMYYVLSELSCYEIDYSCIN